MKLEEFKSVDWTKLKEEDPMEYMLKTRSMRDLQENKRLELQKKNKGFKQQAEMQTKWNEELANSKK